jgi:hypothetical protein
VSFRFKQSVLHCADGKAYFGLRQEISLAEVLLTRTYQIARAPEQAGLSRFLWHLPHDSGKENL